MIEYFDLILKRANASLNGLARAAKDGAISYLEAKINGTWTRINGLVQKIGTDVDDATDRANASAVPNTAAVYTKTQALSARIDALQGSYIYRGALPEGTAATQQNLTAFIVTTYTRQPQLGDVVVDNNGSEWYFNGSLWADMGAPDQNKMDKLTGASIADKILTSDANGQAQASAKVFGGATFNATPNQATIPNESSVKTFVDGHVATQAEVDAGENSVMAVTPLTLKNWAGAGVSAYGVLYDPSSSSPVCQKIELIGNVVRNVSQFSGDLFAHDFRRCVMDNLATRHIAYYLDANDSTKKADGSASVLTGADGDVMVEIPVTWWRVTTRQDGKIEYLVSSHPFSGATIHPFFYVSPDGNTARTQYVGAYQATICDNTGARIANMMDQTAASPTVFVTGYKARSVAGCKPWTNMNLATLRTAAKNNGGITTNSLFKQFLFLMMVIEGGSFNTQAAISQGFAYASAWRYTFTRLSGRVNFGNGTGSILAESLQDSYITWLTVTDDKKVVQFVYRGIENPYGQIWEFEDGIQKYENVVDGVKLDGCYWCTAATDLYTSDDQQSAASPVYQRVAHSWTASSGWPKTWDAKTFFPLSVGGSSTTYMCDYFYIADAAGSRVVFRGGRVDNGVGSGAGYVDVTQRLGTAGLSLGGRIAC